MTDSSSTSDPPRAVVYLLVIVFGIASWVDLNGLWVELPILVHELPERWSLPSYMVVVGQFANIGPLLYTLASVYCPGRLSEKGTIYGIIATGIAAIVLLTFYWDRTTLVDGVPHSTALLCLVFFLAIVDTTSSVAFLPFMAVFKPVYMTAYFIGEGFSGLLPALLGLAQGAGLTVCENITNVVNGTSNATSHSVHLAYVESNFSIEVFLLFIGGMIVASGAAFTFLCYHPYCEQEYVHESSITVHKELRHDTNDMECGGLWEDEKNIGDEASCKASVFTANDVNGGCSKVGHNVCNMKRKEYIIGLVLTGWTSALANAVLMSVQSYSCLPYGTQPYHLTTTLSNVANPFSCVVAFFFYITSIRVLSILSLIGSLFGAYIMAAAAMSPSPVLVGTETGSAMIVFVWLMCVFINSYTKVALARLFRREGKTGLLYCGAACQLGSFVGGVLMFLLVNIFHLFYMVPPCS